MNKYIHLFLVITGIAFSAHAHAEITWQPRVTLAQSSYDFDYEIDYALEPDNEILDRSYKTSVDYQKLGVGLTALLGDFYIDGVAQKNISGDTGTVYGGFPEIPDANLVRDLGSSNFDRMDLSLTVGMEVFDHFSIYAGYRYGKTQFTPRSGGIKSTYKTQGPYVGANYTIPISNDSAMAIGGSFAQLDGELQDANDLKYSSDKTGFSYNISYHHNFSKTTGLYIRYSTQSYAYAFNDPGNYIRQNGEPYGPAEITFNEKIQSTELGVHMRF